MDHFWVLMLTAFVVMGSPGPATLAILSTSLGSGRLAGVFLSLGILSGSVMWSVLAAAGTASLMSAHAWILEVFRYLGVAYLLFLSVKAALSALKPDAQASVSDRSISLKSACFRGLAIHLTNPKAVFLFGSLYAVGVPPDASLPELTGLVLGFACVAATVFLGYALLFSSGSISRLYLKFRRQTQIVFSAIFGLAAIRLAFARL